MTRNRTFCIIPLSLILLLLLFAPVRSAERRTALVIGNATYEHKIGPLLNPVNDASDMARALRQVGFHVALVLDADLRTTIEAIDTFSRNLRQGGVGLFYFAGHGIQVDGENYLLPLRTNISQEHDVPYEAVPVGRVLGGMEDADNQLNVIILDACRNNRFARKWRSSQEGLAVVQAVRGSLIAFATAPGLVALDGSGRNGLYTSSLLKHLPTSGLSVEHLFKRVWSEVVQATKGEQIPWESSSLIGNFFFVPQTPEIPPRVGTLEFSPPSMPISPPSSGPDPEATMWARVERSNHPNDITEFLTTYPNGRFVPVARLKLRQLQRLATQQHEEEQTRLAKPERQQREREETETRQRAEAQRLQEEQQHLEEAERRKEREQQEAKSSVTFPQSQVARLEPKSILRKSSMVAVPVTTLRGRSSVWGQAWSRSVSAFRIDQTAVSNREFLEFTKSYLQWNRSQIPKSLHDGRYLKHWEGDETVNSRKMDQPVRYVSYYAASAYCNALGKKIPHLNHYRAATGFVEAVRSIDSISYEASYKAPDFSLMHTEWTRAWWGTGPDPGGRILYQYRTIHNSNPDSSNYSPEKDKRSTGRSLGFRCVEQ